MYLESAAIFLISIYGGYFGAAAGVLLLALLLGAGHETLAHANAGKNVLLGVANGVAALAFVVRHLCSGRPSCRWGLDVCSGRGSVRSSCGTRQPGPMRVLIGASGLALADQARCGHLRLTPHA